MYDGIEMLRLVNNIPSMGTIAHFTGKVTLLKNANLILMRKGLMGIVTTITSTYTRLRYAD